MLGIPDAGRPGPLPPQSSHNGCTENPQDVVAPPGCELCGSLPVEEATVITKIVSGGQTGVDRAALDAAMLHGIPHGGWCPLGRRAEDGRIPKTYLLQETGSADYSQRTEQNVRNSDGTLIVTGGPVTGGTALTRWLAKQIDSPVLVIDLREDAWFEEVEEWLLANRISILNVAGPRESQQPGIQKRAGEWLSTLLAWLNRQDRSTARQRPAAAPGTE